MDTTISTHVGTNIAWTHNYSKPFRDKEEHIDKTKNIEILEYTPIKKKYSEIFDSAVEEYNAKQKRNDRKIDNYYKKVCNDKKLNVCYEMLVQVGNFENHPSEEEQKLILKEFYKKFKENNPNMAIVGAVIHEDEKGVHMHIDYFPFAKAERGLPIQNSLTKALAEMGYKNNEPIKDSFGNPILDENGKKQYEKGSFSDIAAIQWTKKQNQVLEEIVKSYGHNVIHPEREKSEEQKQKHQNIKEYRDNKIEEYYNKLIAEQNKLFTSIQKTQLKLNKLEEMFIEKKNQLNKELKNNVDENNYKIKELGFQKEIIQTQIEQENQKLKSIQKKIEQLSNHVPEPCYIINMSNYEKKTKGMLNNKKDFYLVPRDDIIENNNKLKELYDYAKQQSNLVQQEIADRNKIDRLSNENAELHTKLRDRGNETVLLKRELNKQERELKYIKDRLTDDSLKVLEKGFAEEEQKLINSKNKGFNFHK